MKRSLSLLIGCLLLASCEDDTTNPPPGPVVETREVRDVDYIQHKFFLIDTPDAMAGARPSSLKVYMSNDIILDPIPGWAIPDSTAEGEYLFQAIDELSTGGTPEHGLQTQFELLERDVDYSLLLIPGDTLVMGIELKTPVPPSAQRAVAVSYRNALGIDVGGTMVGDELILEMIKAPVPLTGGHFWTTWSMVVRNAYDLGFTDIDPASLTLTIEDNLNYTREDRSRPEGSDVSYMKIFGLDQGNLSSLIDWERGILWMPAGRAFAPPPAEVQAWTGGAFEFSGVYLPQYETSQRIYDEVMNPAREAEVHQYRIKATLTTPAP